MAAVKLLNGYIDVEKHYNKLVNPCRSISPGASAVNNITDEMVKDKSKFEQIYAEFIDFIADGVIVGHNLAFDMGFLREKVKKMGNQPGERREKMEAQKIAFITKQLELTPDEAKVFWPVYNEYDAKRLELRKSFKNREDFDKKVIEKLNNERKEKNR